MVEKRTEKDKENQPQLKWWHWTIIVVLLFAIAISLFF